MTSYQAVACIKKLVGKKTGHAGTLDPLAEGVLPVAIGQATRLIEYLSGTKTYLARARLGAMSDTYDAEGKIKLVDNAPDVSYNQFENVLSHFRGDIMQKPPAYSALKRGGRPLYELARAGEQVETEPRPITITRLDLLSFEPPDFEIDVECSRGTYIRSLVHDIGQGLGSGAYLTSLIRTKDGLFDVGKSIRLEELASIADIESRLLSLDWPLELASLTLADDEVGKVKNGLVPYSLAPRMPQSEDFLRLQDAAGRPVAIARRDASGCHIDKVIDCQL